jgi:hypothetical protein
MSRLEPYWTRKPMLLSPEALQCIVSICRCSRTQPRVLLSKAVRSYHETGSFLRLIDAQSLKKRQSHAFADVVAVVWQFYTVRVYLGSDCCSAPNCSVKGVFTFHRWPLQARVEVLGKVIKRGRNGKSIVH